MRAKYKISNPYDVECTMEITMTLSAWIKLKESLQGEIQYPGNHLKTIIYTLVEKAQAEFDYVTEKQ